MRKMHRLCFNQLHGLEAQSPPKRPRSKQEKMFFIFGLVFVGGMKLTIILAIQLMNHHKVI